MEQRYTFKWLLTEQNYKNLNKQTATKKKKKNTPGIATLVKIHNPWT